MALIRYPVIQYAYVVNDIEAACHHWIDLIGAGPFFVSKHDASKEHYHRDVRLKLHQCSGRGDCSRPSLLRRAAQMASSCPASVTRS